MTGRFGIYPVFILVSAAFAMIQGCVREDLEDLGNSDMRIRIGAKVEAAKVSTKADIDYDYQGNDLPIDLIRWDENSGGDSPAGRNRLSASMSGTPANDGSWNREITFVDEAQFYLNRTDSVGFAGWYPGNDVPGNGWVTEYGSVIRSDNTMIYNLRTDNGLDTETDVMVSDFVAGTYTSGIPAMQFQHALCMYNIYVYAVDELTAEEWGAVRRISLTNLPDRVVIHLPDDMTRMDTDEITFRYADDEGTKTPYDIMDSPDNPRELPVGLPSTRQEAYIGTVLGGAPVKGVLGIKAYTEKQESGNSVSIARNFKPGYTYNIFLRFSSRGIINAEVSASDWQYNDQDYVIDENFELFTDLSRYGTANSYIISSANRGYCFNGTVKGNGEAGNILTGRDGSTIRLDDSGVDLNVHHIGIVRSDAMMKKTPDGWEMLDDNERKNTPIIELASDQLSNGKVIFKVPGNPDDKNDFSLQYKGNVKIAAFDANGNIVWSWHIWVTDKPLNQGYSNGYVALDRNLGAVTDDHRTYRKAHSSWSGLYYQWGRKDPIFRATVDDSPDNPWLVDGKADISETPGTITDVTRHPVTYYYDRSGGNSWLSPSDPGYRNFDHFWGYISVRDDIVKTIYDPCPPGYRVPGNALWEDPSEGMTHAVRHNDNLEFAGFNFNIDGMIDIYYPGTSGIVSEDGEVMLKDNDITGSHPAGEYVFLHSATPYEGTDYTDLAYHFRYSAAQGIEYNSVLVAAPDDGTVYHAKRSDAYPVRCVFENSAPEITNLSEYQTANCYVVSKSGFYEFDATVRGNGVTALNIVTATGSDYRAFDAGMGSAISGIDHIDVLWWQGDLRQGSWWSNFIGGNPSSDEIDETCPVIVLDDGRLDNGKPLLYIRANENTYGNVGLAAYAENGDILWSWHIWIQPQIRTVSLGDFTLMDRNLGATYCPGTGENYNAADRFAGYGFCYQWGRKDPFFQPETDDTSNGGKSQPWYEKTNGSWNLRHENHIGQQKTIPESVKAPLDFCAANENRWQTTYPNGDGQINDLWGYVGMTGFQGSSFAKTMYDPCPPGYRVMQHDVFMSGHICAADHDLQFSFNKENDYGIYLYNGLTITQRTNDNDYNNQYGGWVGKQTAASAGGIWFPNARAMNSNGLYNSSNSYRLSSATPFSGKSSREIRWWDNYGEYRIQQNHGNDQNWMSDGRVVRCQME